jgi:hypothetical protein
VRLAAGGWIAPAGTRSWHPGRQLQDPAGAENRHRDRTARRPLGQEIPDPGDIGDGSEGDAFGRQENVSTEHDLFTADGGGCLAPAEARFIGGEPFATFLIRYPPLPAGRFRRSARSSDRICPSRPPQKDRFSSSSFLAVFIVTTNPSPSLPPLFEMLWLTMPITPPFMANMGPPECPC